MKKTLLFLGAASAVAFAGNSEALVKKHCASCHMLEQPKPEQIPTLTAPAFDAVIFHLKDAIKGHEEQVNFIVDYVQHPSASKSVCESNKVAKFGVMPSLKGKVTQKELKEIADYLLEKYPHPDFVRMIKEILKNDAMAALKSSPFLINSDNLPHMTKLLIQNWDKAKLGLTPEQKEKLLKIRKETMGGVAKIKQQLEPLEMEVADAMIDREDPKSVEKQLEQIARLKLEASKIHLKCIADTTAVLSEEQVAVLLPFWE
ncbi:MAG: c-type cytochrome [Sulfurovum sp.]|nr:c-type cytochrome [Sulfurovum sp.]